MRFAILATCLLASPAFAQFNQLNGLGITPGQQCPYNFGVGQGAYSARDPMSNVNDRLRFKQEQLQRIDGYTQNDVKRIRQVIKSPEAWDFVERHYKSKGGRDSYQASCVQGTRRSGSAGGQRANVRSRGRRAAATRDSGRIPVPNDFCTYDDGKEKYLNDWDEVVAEDGKVLDEICNYDVPASGRAVDSGRAGSCKRGLTSYYEHMAKRDALVAEIEGLREQQQVAREEADRRQELAMENQQNMQEQQLEGQYCAWCAQAAWQQQQGSAGVMPAINQQFHMMLNFNQRQYQQGRGLPPPTMPWNGRPGVARPGQPTFPGPGRYPALPYAAPVPGYAGIQPGINPGEGYYGGLAGGAGPGAYGCQGTDPNGIGNPNAPPFMPFQNATANPWNNPFRTNPNTFNPAFRNGLMNRGFGPGFGPQVGNGVYQGGYAPPFAPWTGATALNGYAGAGNVPWYNSPALTYGLPVGAGGSWATPANNLNFQMGQMQNRMNGSYGLYAPEIIRPAVGSPAVFPAPLPGGPVVQPGRPPNPVPGGAPNVVRPGP